MVHVFVNATIGGSVSLILASLLVAKAGAAPYSKAVANLTTDTFTLTVFQNCEAQLTRGKFPLQLVTHTRGAAASPHGDLTPFLSLFNAPALSRPLDFEPCVFAEAIPSFASATEGEG